MSDDKRRPSPASRARRIGGRPTPRPQAGQAPRPQPEEVAAAPSRQSTPPTSSRPPTPSTAAPAVEHDKPKPPPRAAAADFEVQQSPSTRAVPLRWLPAGILGLGVLALVVLLVFASHGVYWAKADNSANSRVVAQEKVLAAAKKCFAQINSYDYRHLDGLVADDLACTTGNFSHDLRQTLQTQILKLAPKLNAVQTAQVNRAGIASVSPSGKQVVTLIYGQLAQSNKTTANKSPRIDVVGAVVTVDKVGDSWLISKVDTDVGNSLGS